MVRLYIWLGVCLWLELRTYLLYTNSSAIGVEWIEIRTSLLHPVVDIGHLDSHLLAPSRYIIYPAISWPSARSSSFWLDHECFTLGSQCCHPCDVLPPTDLVLVCCLLCWLHVYSPPNFFVSDLVHSGLSCSFSDPPHLCCCQHLHFFSGDGPVFILVK